MNTARLSFAERAVLHDEALRRAEELRREAIVKAWDAVFGLFARLARRRPRATLASPRDAAARPQPAGPAG